MEKFGRRPTEVAYDVRPARSELIAAHCVWLSDTEIGLMRETRTQISHNPSSNAKLGNGVARLLDYRAAGINVGLGHDSAEVGQQPATVRGDEVRLARPARRADGRHLLQAPALLRMATRNGSAALGHAGQLTRRATPPTSSWSIWHDPMFTPLCRATTATSCTRISCSRRDGGR